jgi:O-antigen/teichoic acid export membrane protein
LFSITQIISILGFCIVFLFSKEITGIIFGDEFKGVDSILLMHMISGVFVFHISIRSRVMLADNFQLVSFLIIFFSLILNILLNFLLIERYGAFGAAASSAISWGANALVFPLFFKNNRRYPFVFMLSSLFVFGRVRHAVKI